MAIPGIQEIQALATKYSKPQLQKMAQMGLIDPTKAVMAGMMIDRIQQQNTQPPQQTVAEEVMGAAPPPPPGGAPSAPPPGGVAGLPSNLPPQMAGGGIVAFAEGGDTEDYAGGGAIRLAGGGDFRNEAASRVDPRVQALRDKDRYQILLDELPQIQRRIDAGDPRAPADLEALKREIRAVQPRNAVDISLPGISEARAAEPSSLPPIAPAPAKSTRPKSSTERLMEEQVMEDYGLGPQKISPELKKASEESAARALERQAKQKELRQLEGGFFEQKPLTDEQAARAAQLRQEIESFNKLPPIAAPTKKPEAAPAPAPAPAPVPKAAEKEVPKAEKAEVGPPRPDMFAALRNIGIQEPEALTLDKALEEQDKAYEKAGVNKDLFAQIRQDAEARRGKFKDRADKAAGHALMMFGIELFGARKGEVAATASRGGQKSLMMYMSTMDKLAEQDDKLDQYLRELTVAEDQYKRTRADSALAKVQKQQEKIDAIRLENAKLELTAMAKAAEFNVDLIKNENPPQYKLIERIAKESGKSPVDIFMMAQGVAKTGGLTLNQALEAVQRNTQFMGKTPGEQMQEAQRIVGASGGGGATYNYVPGKGLVPTQ